MSYITQLIRPANSIIGIAHAKSELLFIKSGTAEYRRSTFVNIKNKIQYFLKCLIYIHLICTPGEN